MTTFTGKAFATIRMHNGSVINMFNRSFSSWGTSIDFLDPNGTTRYKMAIDQVYMKNKYRCACFTYSFTASAISMSPRVVLYVPGKNSSNDSNENSSASGDGSDGSSSSETESSPFSWAYPIFELICPTISSIGNGVYQLTWWSNVDNYNAIKDENGTYIYNPTQIKKFSEYSLSSNASRSGSCANIVCTAPLHFENLMQNGTDKNCYFATPVIKRIAIIDVIPNNYYVTDFSGAGGGDGIGMHSHLNNNDGGFAAAVFMPSAIMKPFTWS